MIFHWSLSDSKSPQVFRTLFSVHDDLNNAVVWLVSTRPLISKSSSPFINPLVTVPRAPIRIGITVTFMFLQFPSKVEIFIFLFTFFQFYSVGSWDNKVNNFASSFFFFCLIIIRSCLYLFIYCLFIFNATMYRKIYNNHGGNIVTGYFDNCKTRKSKVMI